nr:butyrophilin subfamily 1 member A1 isoform X2 [Anas platyrhynchos]
MRLPWGCSHPSLTGHARGLLTSLITLLLLRLGSAQLRVEGPGHPVTATVGQDVVLPCHLSPQRDARSLEVTWIRDDLSETVHHYHNGEDLYGEQMRAYAGRTELVRDGLSAGSLDLRITGLRPSDDGQYVCTVKNADAYDEATVELVLSATGTDPHLSLGGYEAGGVRVRCRSAGWYPLPQLLWRDARGQHLPSVSQTHSQDQEGLFEIEGAIIVTGNEEGPLSCVVRNSRLQQEWKFSLHIAAPFFHNAQPWMVALALVLVLLAVSIGLGVYLFRKQAAQRRELVELAAKLEEQAALLDEYRAKDVQQSARLKDLTADLLRKDKELKEKEAELAQKDKKLVMKDKELEEKEAELAELKAERDVYRQKAERQSARLKDLTAEMDKKDAKLKEQAAGQARRNFLLSHNTVKVTLDPRTAHPMLVLSQDKSSVRWQSKWQQVPKAPERFDTSCCVLGRDEFREGRHCWEVEVEGEKGKYSSLAVGVARASVKRKGEINMSPEEGIWAVQYKEGQLMSLTSPHTPLSLSPVPTRIWVCLDFTQGQVSFINADNGVEIFIFTDVFLKGESMRPWFWLGTNAQLCLRDNTL